MSTFPCIPGCTDLGEGHEGRTWECLPGKDIGLLCKCIVGSAPGPWHMLIPTSILFPPNPQYSLPPFFESQLRGAFLDRFILNSSLAAGISYPFTLLLSTALTTWHTQVQARRYSYLCSVSSHWNVNASGQGLPFVGKRVKASPQSPWAGVAPAWWPASSPARGSRGLRI